MNTLLKSPWCHCLTSLCFWQSRFLKSRHFHCTTRISQVCPMCIDLNNPSSIDCFQCRLLLLCRVRFWHAISIDYWTHHVQLSSIQSSPEANRTLDSIDSSLTLWNLEFHQSSHSLELRSSHPPLTWVEMRIPFLEHPGILVPSPTWSIKLCHPYYMWCSDSTM